jgi:hypothetical protein
MDSIEIGDIVTIGRDTQPAELLGWKGGESHVRFLKNGHEATYYSPIKLLRKKEKTKVDKEYMMFGRNKVEVVHCSPDNNFCWIQKSGVNKIVHRDTLTPIPKFKFGLFYIAGTTGTICYKKFPVGLDIRVSDLFITPRGVVLSLTKFVDEGEVLSTSDKTRYASVDCVPDLKGEKIKIIGKV